MADLINNNTPVAFFAHPRKLASPGRQLIDGVLSGCALDRLLRLIQKHNHRCGGFRYPSSGDAVWILAVLRHPPARRDFLQLTRVSPDSFRSDEDCARALSVGWMIGNLATRLDAQFNKWFGPFCHERHMAQTPDCLICERFLCHFMIPIEEMMILMDTIFKGLPPR